MTYNPKDHLPQDPAHRLSRDLERLTVQQRASIFDTVMEESSLTAKSDFFKLMPKPLSDDQEKSIDKMSDEEKASHVGALALKLTPDQQKELHEDVAEMAKDAEKKRAKKEHRDQEKAHRKHAAHAHAAA